MNSIFQVITLVWTLQGGQYTTNAIELGSFYTSNAPYFFETSFEFQIPLNWKKGDMDNFFIGADTESQFFQDKSQIGFYPWQDRYRFNAGIRVFGAEFGYQHQCTHPVVTTLLKASEYFDGYDKIYVKVVGSF